MPKKQATLLGCVALLLWGFSAVIIVGLRGVPIFQLVALSYGLVFALTALWLTWQGRWGVIFRQPLWLFAMSFVGIYINDLTYISALHWAPPVQADLINYLWPILAVLLGASLNQRDFGFRHVLATAIAFSGIVLLLTRGQGVAGFHWSYWPGYSMALLDAFIWAGYTVVLSRFPGAPVEVVGISCGAGALLSGLLHWHWEPTVALTTAQWLLIVALALGPSGLAYFLWDRSSRWGRLDWLSLASYITPIFSVSLLIVFHQATFHWSIAIACAGVVGGAMLIGEVDRIVFRYWRSATTAISTG